MAWEADDAVVTAPNLHQIIFENDAVRMLKVTVPVSSVAAMHWHPDSVNYVLSGGKLRFSFHDGSSREVVLETGTIVAGSEGRHKVENIGETEVQTIQTEFKK